MAEPRVTVVVPARNAARTIGACLSALGRQRYPAGRFEVLVVDDGSRDGTGEVAARRGVRLLRINGRGPAAARNAGARAASGDLVLFTDADCQPDPDWVPRMVAPFEDPAVVATKGVYRTEQTTLIARFVQAEYEEKYRRMAGFPTIDFVDTYAAAYRRDVFLQAGGFDERYTQAANEDLDLSYRLAELGYRMVFVADAVVVHRHPDTVISYARRKFKVGYWKPLLHRDHPAKARSDSHTPPSLRWQVALAAVIAGALPLAPRVRVARCALVGALAAHALSSFPLAGLAGQRDRRLLLASPPLVLVRSFALGLGYLAGWWALRRADA